MSAGHARPAVKIDGLHPLEYEHPFDSRALDALEKTPGVDQVIRQFNKHAVERFLTIQFTGSHLKITREDYPDIHGALDDVCEIINLPERPALYVQFDDRINGFTIGVERPIIVLSSGTIDLLEADELRFVLGHEVGHIKSRHVLYKQVAQFLPMMAQAVGKMTFGVGSILTGLVTSPLHLSLARWDHMSEFTADRAGLLACQDVDAATRLMMKVAGMPHSHYGRVRPDSFIRQAKEFEALDFDKLNAVVKFLSSLTTTHPWTVIRAAEMLRWAEAGELQAVLARQTVDRVQKLRTKGIVSCRRCNYRLEGPEKFCPACGAALAAGGELPG